MRTGDDSHHIHGTDEGRNAFTTMFNLWRHPSNPTFNSIHSPKPKIINSSGYALIPDELSKNELDEEMLEKDNAELEKKQKDHTSVVENSEKIAKYIVGKSEAEKIIGDIDNDANGKYDNMNNNEPINEQKTKSIKHDIRSKDKSKLNLNVDEALFAKI